MISSLAFLLVVFQMTASMAVKGLNLKEGGHFNDMRCPVSLCDNF